MVVGRRCRRRQRRDPMPAAPAAAVPVRRAVAAGVAAVAAQAARSVLTGRHAAADAADNAARYSKPNDGSVAGYPPPEVAHLHMPGWGGRALACLRACSPTDIMCYAPCIRKRVPHSRRPPSSPAHDEFADASGYLLQPRLADALHLAPIADVAAPPALTLPRSRSIRPVIGICCVDSHCARQAT